MAFKLLETTTQEIWEDIKAQYLSITGSNLVVSSQEGVMAGILAYIRMNNITDINYAFRQSLVQYADTIYLNELGFHRDTIRDEGQAATCILEFTFNAPLVKQMTIPIGTRVKAVDEEVYFATNYAILCDVGEESRSIEATCTEKGVVGNGYNAGDISNLFDLIPFVQSVMNTDLTQDGAEEESDERYRTRLKLSMYKASTAGAKESIMYWGYTFNNNIINVSAKRGIPGEILVYPLLREGEITTSTFNTSLQEFLNNDKIKPICVDLTVNSVALVPFKLSLALQVLDGYDITILEANIRKSIDDFNLSMKTRVGHDFIMNQLNAVIMSNAGVKKIEYNSGGWFYYGRTTDLEIDDTQVCSISDYKIELTVVSNI